MLKNLISKFLLITVIATSLTFSGCRKEKDPILQTEERQNSNDNATSEANFDDAENITANFTQDRISDSNLQRTAGTDGINTTSQFNCGTVTIFSRKDTLIGGVSRPWRGFVVDFGNGSTACADGKIRRGKIRVVYIMPQGWTYQLGVGLHRVSGAIRVVNFFNYFVGTTTANLTKVEGTLTVTNNTPATTNANPVYRRQVVGGKLTFADNTTFSWDADRTITWTEGWNTLAALINPFDDKFSMTGTYAGINRNGGTFAGTIDNANPVIISTECYKNGVYQPVSGKVTLIITPPNRTPRTLLIDYGTGACDKSFTVTINGQLVTVTQP